MPAARHAMRTLSGEELGGIIQAAAGLAAGHPAYEFTLDEALEDAAFGGYERITRLRRRRTRRAVTRDELRRARTIAELNGETGEQFINEYLGGLKAAGVIAGFVWESEDDAVAPFDFTVSEPGGDARVDVKATDGGFERKIHVSYGELIAMADPSARYDIYRVYDLQDEAATMRVARDLRTFAQAALTAFKGLAPGVTADGVSVDPRTLPFAATAIPLTLTVEED